MSRQRRVWLGVGGALLALLRGTIAQAATADDIARRVRLDIGFHYSAGDYDTSSTTEIYYVPFTIRGELGRWSFRTTIPYLWIRGNGGVVAGPSGPVQTTSGSADGLGDILARGGYWLPPLLPWMPFIELAGTVKFPTADRSDGLGTGRFDFHVDSELTWVVRRFIPFATLGYRFLGDRPGERLHDVFAGSVGGQYRVFDSLDVGVMADYRERASSVSGERVEIIPFASVRVQPHWLVGTYVSAGLATGSPDVGTGLQIGYAF